MELSTANLSRCHGVSLGRPIEIDERDVVKIEPVKFCFCCRGVLPISNFSKNKSRADGLCHLCKNCDNAYRAGKYLRKGK